MNAQTTVIPRIPAVPIRAKMGLKRGFATASLVQIGEPLLPLSMRGTQKRWRGWQKQMNFEIEDVTRANHFFTCPFDRHYWSIVMIDA